ncbi:MAG TPA: toll/interleukin-1 receptor domain-containing protein [Candidatus Binatia bacterium]|nr:toll/interleukin-1 receptor domain-containing protein [Candidatus Binatia bacterium]
MTAYDVFISYARADTARARMIRDRLAALGLSVFFDTEGIDTGEEFPVIIDRAVKSAKCVLGLWSRNAFAGRWVRIESRIGLDQNKLAPALIDGMRPEDLPAEFYNVNVVSLADYHGQDGHEGWGRVLRAIGKRVGRNDLASAPAKNAPLISSPSTLIRIKELNPVYMAGAGLALIVGVSIFQSINAPSATQNRFNAPVFTAEAAASTADITGRWGGVYTEAGRETRFELHLQRGEDGAFSGSVSEQDIYGISGGGFTAEISGEVLADGVVRFTKTYPAGSIAMRPVIYEGRLSADGRTIAGSWDTGTLHGPFQMEKL